MARTLSTRTTVFLVDDSDAIRTRLSASLCALQGIAVVGIADTAESAIEAIQRARPDYVILDVHLRDGNGIEVLRKIHKIHPGIIFIVLTNQAFPQYRELFMAAGASHFLDKHAEFGKVKQIVAEFIATR